MNTSQPKPRTRRRKKVKANASPAIPSEVFALVLKDEEYDAYTASLPPPRVRSMMDPFS